MRVLVTGSTGFLGSNLAAALAQQGHTVVGLRRANSPDDAIEHVPMTFVTGDILDADSLIPAMKGIDWVFHAAAIADYWRTPASIIYKVNVDGTKHVLAAALMAGARRVVLTSSTAALGMPRREKELLDESDWFNLRPEDFYYGDSKRLAEEAAADYASQGLDVVSVLPAAVMGPRDLKFNAGELIAQALNPTIPFIPLPQGGLNFIDVRDCVEGHISAAQKGAAGERYILAGHNMTHRRTMEIVNQVLGTAAHIVELPRWLVRPMAEVVGVLRNVGVQLPVDRGRILHSKEYIYYDNTKAIHHLGLTIRPFEESVLDAYKWYEENGYLQKRGLPLAPISKRH
jgi:dihydroflavonol-4-reductase